MTSPPDPLDQLSVYLQEITEALAATTTQREVIEIVLTPAVQALGATAGIVLFVDQTDQQIKVAGSQGYQDGVPTLWQEGSIEDHVLIADILRMKEARYFEDAGALRGAYPELESRTGGLLPVANATLPMFLDHRPLGVIVLDFKEPHHFTPAERRFLTILSAQCAVALGRAEATRLLEARVEDRTRQLETERAALAAFVAFTEAVGSETALATLIRQASAVLQHRFSGATVVFYVREGDLWKAQLWSEDTIPALAASLAAGLPLDTPLFAQTMQTRQAVFTDGWDAGRERIKSSEEYGAGASYPLLVNDEVRWLLAIGLRETRSWTQADRSLVRSVGRGLNLALERTETARELTRKNAELETNAAELQARTRALEAFAELTRDLALTTDPLLLIRRALEVVMSMLPSGVAMYFVPEGGRWYSRVQHGSVNSPQLQAVVDAGLSDAEAGNLVIPWTTGKPHFQNVYPQDGNALASVVTHIQATATLPLRQDETPIGVLAFVLFDQRPWTSVDRVVLETTVRSLELALDRARQTRTVMAQRDALDARTQELQAFSYSVSHDLRTPVRHMIGFLQLARKALDGRLDDHTRRYLDVVEQAGTDLNTLIDAMLDLSRAVQEPLRPTMVDLNMVMVQLQETLVPDLMSRNVQWQVAPLPSVYGDRDALKQVLSQLTENALKFTRSRDPAVIRVWAEEQGDCWKVLVSDNGLGFDPRYGERLFNLFQRLHSPLEAPGSGVGLAQVKRLILKHGGQVSAEGRLGEGATFGFTLPKSRVS